MLNDLKRSICRANKELHKSSGARVTWCSVSGFDMSMGLFVVRPTDIPFEELQPEQMVVVSMDGQKVEGRLEPIWDAETHRAMYMAWAMSVGAIVQINSLYASSFAQAGMPIPITGAMYAEYFHDTVPVSRFPTQEEVQEGYEYKLGELATHTVADPEKTPAVLMAGHGAFVWGRNAAEAVQQAFVLEDLACVSYLTRNLNPQVHEIDASIRDHRYSYRHGTSG